MRRSARVLPVAAMAAVALGGAVPLASAEPAAEVSPAAARPGDTVTVAVVCDPVGGAPPEVIDAASEAFAGGSVSLRRVPGDDAAAGPVYRGSARTLTAGGSESAGDPAGGPEAAGDPAGGESGWDAGGSEAAGDPVRGPEAAGDPAGGESGWDAGGKSPWTVDGTCPAEPGGQGKPWRASFTATREEGGDWPACSGPPESCGSPTLQRGVQAGRGGAFNDSVPALVAGGLLIAGALGAAAHRLWRRDTRGDA
ncbi:hypothetical protein [Streptomyces chromofuscus]|uniref:Secreted protein n=1 Tax=Streptomyces chromofuscus TaxID=42881 RepID=A0A7M2T5L5_STRCW|nr:hypothetical protein [Streptomyces chromofuscus]QOV43967.1 hypothetical protein IPT68_30575 [Streptomyces chromofuscus]GGT06737.1 hypothetical protein GCM10010254_29070 [Streptomyces chromofuscus]